MSKRYVFVAVVRSGATPPELTEKWELVKTNPTDQVFHARLDEEFVLVNQTRLMQALGADPSLLWFNIQPERAGESLAMRLRDFLSQYYYGLWVGDGYSVRKTSNVEGGESMYTVTRMAPPDETHSYGSTYMRASEVRTLFGNDALGQVAYTGN